MRGRADFARDVAVDRKLASSRFVGIELLQLGIAHRSQRVFGIAGAVDVAFSDAHAEDGDMPPAIGARIESWRLVGFDPPHLLFAAAIILPIIRNSKRR